MAKKIFKSDKGVKNLKLMHPKREWGVGILAGLFILGGSGFWSANTYISYRNQANLTSGSVEGEVIVYRASQVEAALSAYAERIVKYEALVRGNSLPSAPETLPEAVSITTEETVEDSDLVEEAVLDTEAELEVETGTEESPDTPEDQTQEIFEGSIQVN